MAGARPRTLRNSRLGLAGWRTGLADGRGRVAEAARLSRRGLRGDRGPRGSGSSWVRAASAAPAAVETPAPTPPGQSPRGTLPGAGASSGSGSSTQLPAVDAPRERCRTLARAGGARQVPSASVPRRSRRAPHSRSGLAPRAGKATKAAGPAGTRGVEATFLAAASAEAPALTSTPRARFILRARATRRRARIESAGRHRPAHSAPDTGPRLEQAGHPALLILAVWFGIRARFAGARARRLERQRAGCYGRGRRCRRRSSPSPPPAGWAGVSVAYRPAEARAGGDFYDLFIPQPGWRRFMLGDVSGPATSVNARGAYALHPARLLQAGSSRAPPCPWRDGSCRTPRAIATPPSPSPCTRRPPAASPTRWRVTLRRCCWACRSRAGDACFLAPVGWAIPTDGADDDCYRRRRACSSATAHRRARRPAVGQEHVREILAGLGPPSGRRGAAGAGPQRGAGGPTTWLRACSHPRPLGGTGIHTEELEVDSPCWTGRGAAVPARVRCSAIRHRASPRARRGHRRLGGPARCCVRAGGRVARSRSRPRLAGGARRIVAPGRETRTPAEGAGAGQRRAIQRARVA